MNSVFIESTIQVAKYELKEGTSTSYHWKAGSRILPNRMSISFNSELSKAERKGRMISLNVIGEIKASFTKNEESPLKQHKPFNIHSKIFQPVDYPSLCYGVLAVTNSEGKCTKESEEGLLVFRRNEKGNAFVAYYMAGVTENPTELDEVLAFVSNNKKGVE